MFEKLDKSDILNLRNIQAKSLSLQPYYNESLNIDGEIKLKTPIEIKLVPQAISYYSF